MSAPSGEQVIEFGYLMAKASNQADGDQLQLWLTTERGELYSLAAKIIDLGPLVIRRLLSEKQETDELSPRPFELVATKARLLKKQLPNIGRDYTGWSFGQTLAEQFDTLRRLGIIIPNAVEIISYVSHDPESLKSKPTYFRWPETQDFIRDSICLRGLDLQFDFCSDRGGRMIRLWEVLDLFIDLAIVAKHLEVPPGVHVFNCLTPDVKCRHFDIRTSSHLNSLAGRPGTAGIRVDQKGRLSFHTVGYTANECVTIVVKPG